MPIMVPHEECRNRTVGRSYNQRRYGTEKTHLMGLARDRYLRMGYLMPVGGVYG